MATNNEQLERVLLQMQVYTMQLAQDPQNQAIKDNMALLQKLLDKLQK